MTNMKTWLASAVLVGGAGTGGVLGLAAATGPASPTATPSAPRQQGSVGAAALERQTSSLMADDRALARALARARRRLADEVTASEHSLAVLRQRVATREAALARAQAQVQAAPATVLATSVAPASAPTGHATTGASGAGATSGGREGESDD